MIDIVYILGKGSKFLNIEIMLSIRSIEQAKLKYRNIVIVGEKPTFLKDVIHIPVEEAVGVKEYRIAKKIEFVCSQPNVSDDFLFFNDDFFITKKFDIENYPYYNKGTLKREKITHPYFKHLNETYEHLKSIGKETNHFDLHVPIVYNKKKFLELSHIWDKKCNFVVKSTYCNYHNIKGISKIDFKIKKPTDVDTECFSTYDELQNGLLTWLFDLYPKPSKYELMKKYNLIVLKHFNDKVENIKRKQKQKFSVTDEKRMTTLIDSKVCKLESIEEVEKKVVVPQTEKKTRAKKAK
jgi:hypothetical protein